MTTPLARQLGIEVPLFAFSYEPAVVAAVSKAGGLGVLGAVRFSPEELDEALTWIEKELDGRPYGLDIVMPATSQKIDAADAEALLGKIEEFIPAEHREFVERVLDEHGVPPLAGEPIRGLLGWTDQTARPQIEVAMTHDFCLLANALGPPPADIIATAHDRDILVAALVGSVDQARKQRAAGVDVVVAQGTEAGGHTGEVATMVLVPEVVDALDPAPVLAAGGIGRGRQLAAALALGAQGAWTGSVWLATREVEHPRALIDKLLAASSRDTVRSRAMTGKPARQLRTAWTEAWDSPESPGALPMPLQYFLTADAQQRIRESEHPELLGIPVGQIVGAMNEVRSAGEVVRSFVEEFREALERLNAVAL